MKVNRFPEGCEDCNLSFSCFFPKELPVDKALPLKLVQDITKLKKSETLYHQGEKFRGLFTVKEGALKSFLLDESGEQVVAYFYLPGEIVGFDAIHNEKYQENIIALTDTEVCRISFKTLLQLATQDAHFQQQLFKLFSLRIQRMRHNWHFNAEQKVALFLLDYAHRLMQQNQPGDHFYLFATQQDIASYLNLTPETISRIFRKFLAAGIYQSTQPKKIEHLDHHKLQEMIRLP